MAFKSFDELINMANQNPKMAKIYVARAKKIGRPVVSSNNPGYSGVGDTNSNNTSDSSAYRTKAIENRLGKEVQDTKKNVSERLNSAVKRRMKNKYPPMTDQNLSSTTEDAIVTARKKVGY